MNKLLLVLMISVIATGCHQPSQKKPVPKKLTYEDRLKNHIDSLQSFKDTTFLGFVLGASKAATSQHLKKLIREGKTEKLQTYTLTIFDQSTSFTGHPYRFYLDNQVYDTTFELAYSDGELLKIDLFLLKPEESSVINFISKKYGPRFHILEDKTTFKKTHIWLRNNTQITYDGRFLSYSDLRKTTEIKKILKEIDRIDKTRGSKETEADI